MTRGFEFVEDLTSDVMFRAHGRTLEELFANAAKGLFAVMSDEVKGNRWITVKLEAEDTEGLLYSWLSTLLAESELRNMIFSEFKLEINGNKLKARVRGGKISPEKAKVQVKAITMYKFGITQERDGYTATVSCDV